MTPQHQLIEQGEEVLFDINILPPNIMKIVETIASVALGVALCLYSAADLKLQLTNLLKSEGTDV